MKRIFLLAFLGGLLLAAQVSGDQEVSVVGLDLFGAFEAHASVYLCTVAKREPYAVQPERVAESGKVELTINKVLFGTKLENITLPYRFWLSDIAAGFDGPLTWPQFQNGNKLLCVVLPYAQDPGTSDTPQTVASKVLVVTGEKDAKVQEMMAVCTLYETRNTPEFIPGLEKAMADPRPELRDFAMQALLNVGKTSPDTAIKVIQSRVAHYTGGADAAEGDGFISLIGGDLFRSGLNKDVPWFLRCLATLSQSESKNVRQLALGTLAFYIPHPNSRELRVEDVLNAGEQQALRKTVAKSETEFGDQETRDNIRAIRMWLNR